MIVKHWVSWMNDVSGRERCVERMDGSALVSVIMCDLTWPAGRMNLCWWVWSCVTWWSNESVLVSVIMCDLTCWSNESVLVSVIVCDLLVEWSCVGECDRVWHMIRHGQARNSMIFHPSINTYELIWIVFDHLVSHDTSCHGQLVLRLISMIFHPSTHQSNVRLII